MNEIREKVWRALLTYDPAKKANLHTYVNRVIENYFSWKLRQSSLKKHNSLDYYSDVFTSVAPGDPDEFITQETGETQFERRHEFMKDLAFLNEADRVILTGLAQGYNMADLVEMSGRPRPEVTAAVNRIAVLIKKRRERG